MASNSDKFLGEPGLAKLIDLVRSLVSSVQSSLQASIVDLEDQIEQAGSGVTADETTITKSDSGVLSAKTDVEGGVTSFARHQADIVVDDGATTSKTGNEISVRAGGIQSTHLSNGCVTADKIASSAVTSDKLADGSVETECLADGAVTSEKISGVLPVSKGGTGATTGKQALSNLGLKIVDSVSDLSASDGYAISPKGVYDLFTEVYGTVISGTATASMSGSSGGTFPCSISAVSNGFSFTTSNITIPVTGSYHIVLNSTVSASKHIYNKAYSMSATYTVSGQAAQTIVSASGGSFTETGSLETVAYLTAGQTISFACTLGVSPGTDPDGSASATTSFTINRTL